MPKITFMGAGSSVFVKNICGDSMLCPSLHDAHFALYDIDPKRLRESKKMLECLNTNINEGRAKITAHLGSDNRKAALKGANYVINAIQVGGYEPATVIDFEIPKKYGLRQTIGDTLGIGGIFRALRTIPVLQDFARDMEKVCPDAWFLNYSNPMSMLTGSMLRGSSIRAVGLCHSVQGVTHALLISVGMQEKWSDKPYPNLKWQCAGINHMGWLLEIKDDDRDLYPEIKKRAEKKVREERKKGNSKFWDLVRLEMMRNFGYYITESSEHTAEYNPYFIKSTHPELIQEFNIPLDEYPRRCIDIIAHWKKMRDEVVNNKSLTHARSWEYGSVIMDAMETNIPAKIGGNVLNNGFIPNLPAKAVVEIPCMIDRNGVQGIYVGELPEQCAALNRNHINVHLLTIDAALNRKREKIYQAAMLDPHTAAELTLDQIRALCDDLIEAHGSYLPRYR